MYIPLYSSIHISIHALLAGSDTREGYCPKHKPKFQSTLPLRGATEPAPLYPSVNRISIHAPLAGSDGAQRHGTVPDSPISIHAPLAGSDPARTI